MNEVICGDCTVELPKLPSESINLIITDPPWQKTDYSFDQVKIDWDFIFQELKRILKPNGWFFCFAPMNILNKITDNNWRQKFEYIWVKPGIIPTTHNTIRPTTQHEFIGAFIKPELKKVTELCFNKKELQTIGKTYNRKFTSKNKNGFLTKENRRTPTDKNGNSLNYNLINNGIRSPSTVIYYPNKNRLKFNERTEHPTQKPLALLEYILSGYSNPNESVLDPFAGSGTTIEAAKKLNRNYIGIEINPNYHKIIENRLVKHNNHRMEAFT